VSYGSPKRFKAVPPPKKVGSSNEGKKRHVGASTQAARLGSFAHKAAHAAGKAKHYGK
jgi:hypothetical protein